MVTGAQPLWTDDIGNIACYSRVASLTDNTGQVAKAMTSTLVTRNQFNITPQGIVHKPTEAAFIPHPGDPHSGIFRLGQLYNQPPNWNHYEPEDVQRMMRELWDEFVAENPDMFKT
jgi:hypothetical protein